MNYSKGEIILLAYPFTDLSTQKVRPAVVVSSDDGKYDDIFVVPLTSKVHKLSESEFVLANWEKAGLNVPSAIKRGCILIDINLVIKKVGRLSVNDLISLDNALKTWLGL